MYRIIYRYINPFPTACIMIGLFIFIFIEIDFFCMPVIGKVGILEKDPILSIIGHH